MLSVGCEENLGFDDFALILPKLGWHFIYCEGDHHIFLHDQICELINVQEVNNKIPPYQLDQWLKFVERYNLGNGGQILNDYHINIFYSEEDEAYIADIPDLEFCSAFGDTPEEALCEIQIAKELWLEASREDGKPIPPPRYRPSIYQPPFNGGKAS